MGMSKHDEAVESAAKAHLDERGESTWDDLSEQGRKNRRRWMRAALEAAAPHMLAEAWESAYGLGYADRNVAAAPTRPNPYRATK